jgi:hypothetical protein
MNFAPDNNDYDKGYAFFNETLAPLIRAELAGRGINWETEFAEPFLNGIGDAFADF